MIFISGLFRCFTQLSSFILLEIAEMLRCAGALGLDNRKVFQCPGCKVSLVFFLMNKCDSGLLKCLFLSGSPIGLSRGWWGVYSCLQCVEVTQVSYFVLYVSSPCLVGLAAEINKSNQVVVSAVCIDMCWRQFSRLCFL